MREVARRRQPRRQFVDVKVASLRPLGTAKGSDRGWRRVCSFTAEPDSMRHPRAPINRSRCAHTGRVKETAAVPGSQDRQARCEVRQGTKYRLGSDEAELTGATGAPPPLFRRSSTAYNGKPLSGKATTLIFIASPERHASAELDFAAKRHGRVHYGLEHSRVILPGSSPSSFGITSSE